MVVRGGEKTLVGWATTKSCNTAPATVVDGSQTSHSLQLAATTEMRTFLPFVCLTPRSALLSFAEFPGPLHSESLLEPVAPWLN